MRKLNYIILYINKICLFEKNFFKIFMLLNLSAGQNKG